jgi:hypothetical protein
MVGISNHIHPMGNRISILLLAFACLIMPTPASAATASEIQTQIQALMAQIAAMRSPATPISASNLTVSTRATKDGVVSYQLSLPAKYAGDYVVLLLNPVSTSRPISSGTLTGFALGKGWAGGTLFGDVGVQRLHQGFADNQGGVHWFSTVPGTYRMAAVVYAASPFKPGTEMEYLPIGTQPSALEILNSNTLVMGGRVKQPSCTIRSDRSSASSNESFRISWKTKNISDPVLVEDIRAGGARDVRKNGSATYHGSGDTGTFSIRDGSGVSLCSTTVGVRYAAEPSCTILADRDSYRLGDRITVSWTSTNADSARWLRDTSGKDNFTLPSRRLRTSGSYAFLADVIGNPFVTLEVTGDDGTATCKRILPVQDY